jgi:hypothetical protein
MPLNVLSELIDKQDNSEVIRDQIVAILKTETAAQQILATAAAKDPAEWKLRVYAERSNPIESWLNITDDNIAAIDKSPIINVWFDNSNFDLAGSDIVKKQHAEGSFNIDCYGLGISKPDGVGQILGDEQASFEVQRAVKLVRNMLMAGETNVYLQLRGIVGRRWIQSINIFQVELNARQAQKIVGARINFAVSFNEFSPQYTGVPLEIVRADVKRAEDDAELLKIEYDYT